MQISVLQLLGILVLVYWAALGFLFFFPVLPILGGHRESLIQRHPYVGYSWLAISLVLSMFCIARAAEIRAVAGSGLLISAAVMLASLSASRVLLKHEKRLVNIAYAGLAGMALFAVVAKG